MSVTQTDVLIIGAGAAGLLAAATAAAGGVRTLVVEKTRQTGVKVLVAGGGHCNLTNTRSVRTMLEGFQHASAFLTPSMKKFSPQAVRRHFESRGVPTCSDDRGKVWPVSRRARDVRDALENEARAAGAEFRLNAPATWVERREEGFVVGTPLGTVACRRLVIATGGCSYPAIGTTGDGYRLATTLGHSLVEPVPALVPLVVDVDWVRHLSGVSLPDVRLGLYGRDGQAYGESRGPLLFTHKGISGPAGLDLGGRVARHGKRADLEIDWLPEMVASELEKTLRDAHGQGRQPVKRLLTDLLPERLVVALMTSVGIPADRQTAQFRTAERQALITAVKASRVEVAGTLGFKKAEVTAGGIPLEEVDPITMASRIVPGLYLAGEVLDYDGPEGGYNLQAAFCTGKAAGAALSSG